METGQGAVYRWVWRLGLLVLGVALVFAGPSTGQVPPFNATKSFSPGTILSGNPATLVVRLQNINPFLAASTISFSDTFPAGMVLVPGDPPAQCGGTLAFAANGFTFTNGTVAVASFCDVNVTVTANSPTSTKLTNVTSAISYSYGAGVQTIAGVSGVLNVTGGTPPAITSAPPPDGQLGVPYDYAIAVSGTAPIAVSASGLPPGLSFSPTTLHISGTPVTVGAYPGTIAATNGFLPNASQNYTINIRPPVLTIVTPPSALAPPVTVGNNIDVTLQAAGGLPPYLWSVSGGVLPPGVTLDSGGHLSGKPSKPGSYTFAVNVNDSTGASATQTYTIEIVKIEGTFKVTVTPNPVVSGQTMTVAASVAGASLPTGTLEVWIAGAGTRCPAPFKFGDPTSPVAPFRTAPLDARGNAQVQAANLRIDDYGVCAHYSGDGNFDEAFAGPIDAYVIKGVLLAPPKVALAAPNRVASLAAIPAQVNVTSQDASLVPGGSVRVLVNGEPAATTTLAGGIAWVVLSAPAAGTMSLVADYAGDGIFPPASSAPVLIVVSAVGELSIPALSDAVLVLLAVLLAGFAARRLRRRP